MEHFWVYKSCWRNIVVLLSALCLRSNDLYDFNDMEFLYDLIFCYSFVTDWLNDPILKWDEHWTRNKESELSFSLHYIFTCFSFYIFNLILLTLLESLTLFNKYNYCKKVMPVKVSKKERKKCSFIKYLQTKHWIFK